VTSAPETTATRDDTVHRRTRNARGEGLRLAEEIVSAALALIERSGTEETVTLRAVAREVGIAAPSIYAHYADRQAIMLAVVRRVFDELARAIEAALARAGDDPVDQLVAGCEAYVAYALAHPARYRILFSPARTGDMCRGEAVEIGPDGRPLLDYGGEAFGLLLDGIEACVAAGRSASTDPLADGTALWVAMHGTADLWTALIRFPWPSADDFVRQLVLRLARVTDPAP